MDKKIIDLVNDKKFSEFADIIKNTLSSKINNNEFIKQKSNELNTYDMIKNTQANLYKNLNK